MIRREAFYRILFAFLPTAIICIVVAMKLLGGAYWWLGFCLAQALYAYLNETVFRAFSLLRTLPRERLELNLRAAGRARIPHVFPFQVKFVLIAFALAATFLMVIRNDVSRGLQEIGTILTPEELVLRIEYPTWTEAPPLERKLEPDSEAVTADTASYFEIRARNLKMGTWNLSIAVTQNASADPETSLNKLDVKLGRDGGTRWGQSLARVYEMFALDNSKSATLFLTARDGAGTVLKGRLEVTPLGLPVVTIAGAGRDGTEEGVLRFQVSAESRIPLAQIELQARTRSGYRFSKTAAEYAGSNEKTIKNLLADLNTLGIPFAAKDSLFVRAVAKTIVAGLQGQSEEIEIPIRSRQEIRQELMARLDEALREFQNEKEPWEASRQRIFESLAQALPLAEALGHQSTARRRLGDAMQALQRAQNRKDASAQLSQQKVKAALDSLQRNQTMQETASLFSRLRNLQANIRKANEGELPALAGDAEKLAGETSALKQKLQGLVTSPETGLTPEEKQAAQSMLQADKTEERLRSAEPPLKAGEREAAAASTEEAINEAQKNLAGVVQLLTAARQRAMRQAREQLTDSDQKLQNARSRSPQQGAPEIKGAEETLSKLPKISKEFDDAGSEAHDGAREAAESAKGGHAARMLEGIEKGQEGIVKALEALQDEEQQEREQQQEMEGKEHRSNQELLTAQGVMDAGWRKRILDEISRLRAAGEPSDSPVLKYLESRLR